MLIWLLEDDPAQAELLTGWLTGAGHDVRHFEQGKLILDALPEGKFDLIILDWELPDTVGTEVLKVIRETIAWHVPVLFVTQREAESDIVAATTPVGLEIGMSELLALGEEIALMTDLGVFEAEPDWPAMIDPTVVEAIYS